MRPTRLPVPEGFLLAVMDSEKFCILAFYGSTPDGQPLYRVARAGFRDRYEALSWCYRYIAGATNEQTGYRRGKQRGS